LYFHAAIAAREKTMNYGEKTTTHPTEPGWYYVGLTADEMCGPILQLEDGEWFDENGEEVVRIFDASIQDYASPKNADFWVRQ
jgi:hypothetical protein